MKKTKKKQKTKAQKLRDDADKLWSKIILNSAENGMCEVCGNLAHDPHHFFGKGSAGSLRLNLNNGIPLCRGCHMGIHLRNDPTIIVKIIEGRGGQWYDDLLKEKRKIRHSFFGVKYYEKKIKELEKILNKK